MIEGLSKQDYLKKFESWLVWRTGKELKDITADEASELENEFFRQMD